MHSFELAYGDNKLIRLTQINQLNDPFEYGVSVSADKKAFATYLYNHKLDEIKKTILSQNPALYSVQNSINWKTALTNFISEEAFQNFIKWDEYMQKIINDLSTHTGILSMSSVNDNSLMWAHYTHEHTGFVIEFDLSTPMLNSQFPVKKVRYQDEMINIHFKTYHDITHIHEYVKKTNVAIEALYVKSKDWEYEQEWRFAAPFLECSKSINYRDNPIYLIQFNPKSIKKIFLGCRVSNELVVEIQNLLSYDTELAQVELFKTSRDPHKYQLNFHKI